MICPLCQPESKMIEIDRHSKRYDSDVSGPEYELIWIKYRCSECGHEVTVYNPEMEEPEIYYENNYNL